MVSKWSPAQITTAINKAATALKFEQLKPLQQDAIAKFVQGNAMFVALPTGFDKSVIIGLLPTVFDCLLDRQGSIVCVLSPLVALMRDLKGKFVPRGLSAEFLGELQADANALTRVLHGNHQLVFMSPESLLDNPDLRNMLLSSTYRERLVAVVIDEAHCIDKW